jgi:DNA-binding NarL/FixJ family response regulator
LSGRYDQLSKARAEHQGDRGGDQRRGGEEGAPAGCRGQRGPGHAGAVLGADREHAEHPERELSEDQPGERVTERVAEGLSNPEIALRLHITPGTAKTHVVHLLTKLDVRDRIHLAILAHRTGLTT